MQLRKSLSMLAFAAVVATGDFLAAQQPRPTQPGVQVQVQPRQAAQPGQPAQPGQRAGWQSNDQTIAGCVAIANHEEVALAQFAQSKTKSEDVKDFAEMLISDHQAFLKKLEKFTPEARQSSLGNDQRTTSTQDEGRVQPAGGAQPAQPGRIQQTAGQQPANQSLDMIQIHRDIAAQCLSDTKKMLGEKDADEFDKCFVGLQIAAHASMKSKLTALQRHASGELADVLKDGTDAVKSHLEEAEKLMEQLADAQKSDSKSDRKKSE